MILAAKDVIVECIRKYGVNEREIQTIAKNTVETWEHDREFREKKDNTEVGKLAELLVYDWIKKNCNFLKYIDYDSFRQDNFEKHAPFDALLFGIDKTECDIALIVERINNEILDENYRGHLSVGLRQEIRNLGFLILEIKATNVSNGKRTIQGEVNLSKIIFQDDFLTYPRYARYDPNDSIWTLDDYREKIVSQRSGRVLTIEELLKKEKEIMSDIYIRVYIDRQNKQAYIIGFTTRENFIKNVRIKKFLSQKSRHAIYLTMPLCKGEPIKKMDDFVKNGAS